MSSASESSHIVAARKKLQKRLESIDSQFTPDALTKAIEKIYTTLEQNKKMNELSSHTAEHFSNRHALVSYASSSVIKLREQLLRSFEEQAHQTLKGRISFSKKN
jgi:benzoyl-CoA reductase/2-hydroxyglutaryl-CoA dehydratase subunit BcrC/BadD/HgdB